jgi:hypothetical protein
METGRILILTYVVLCGFGGGLETLAAEPPDFATQIRPILAKNCFSCHGRDEANRETDLRLVYPRGGVGQSWRQCGGRARLAPEERVDSANHVRRSRRANAAGRFGQAAYRRRSNAAARVD